jgi:hypothetical protein
VAGDAARAPLRPAETVARLARAARVPDDAGRLHLVRDVGASVRIVTLDTANRRGGSTGVLTAAEYRWLRGALQGSAGRHLLVVSPTPLEETVGGRRALDLLGRTPGVVAVLSGDTHRSRITPWRTRDGGFWLVRTPSLVDYPQQARAFRLVQLVDGRVALETWMVDHAGRTGASGYLGLAGISRDLAFLDAQGGRPQGWAGRPADRNGRLFLP